MLPALANADVMLAAGGGLFVIAAVFAWMGDSRARGILSVKRFDDDVAAPLENRYLESRSFRDLYNAVHEVAGHPAAMVASMIAVAVVALAVGSWYVTRPDVSLPFIIFVFIVGLVWHFGDVIEGILVISYAGESGLGRSDRRTIEYYGALLGKGKYYFLVLAASVSVASLLNAAGQLPEDSAPLAIIVLAFAPCLLLSLVWRSTLRKMRSAKP